MLSLRRRTKDADPYATLLDPDAEFWKHYRAAIQQVVFPIALSLVLAGVKAGNRARTKAAPKLKPIQLPVGTGLSDAQLKRIMRETVLEYSSDLTDKLYGATYDAVKEAVSKAAAEGKPVSAVVRELKPLFGADRAKMVAVTETTRLMGAGSQALYRAQDVPYWTWMTVQDDLVCPVCDDLEGEIFSQAEDFEPSHPGCRCFPAPSEDDSGKLDLRAAEWVTALRFDPEQPRDEFGRWTDAQVDRGNPGKGRYGFLKEWERVGHPNPERRRERIVGNAGIVLSIDEHKNSVYLDELRSTKRGSPDAIRLMAKLTEMADYHGVTLHLLAAPFDVENDVKGLGQDRLVRFYEHFGFEKEFPNEPDYGGGVAMLRPPRASQKTKTVEDWLQEVSDDYFFALKYSDDQPRDDLGRWTDAGGEGARVAAVALDALKAGDSAKIRPEHLEDFINAVRTDNVQANLSKLQIEGHPNLFDKHLRDRPRGEMPQLPRDNAGLRAFSDYLASQGYRATWEQVDPADLIATQSEMNTAKMVAVYDKYVERGGHFAEDKGTLIVSKEGGILDGHHRWAAAASYSVTHQPTTVNVLRVDTGIDNLLKAADEYPGADEKRYFTLPDPETKPLGGEPTEPPPAGDGWLWFDGQWIQILTDEDDAEELKYDPNEPRDDAGRWTDTGGFTGPAFTGHPQDFIANLTKSVARSMYVPPGSEWGKSEVIVEKISQYRARVHVNLMRDGELVGEMQRIFATDSSGGPSVYHELFVIEDEHQGEGIAAAVNERAEEAYRAAGFNQVTLFADITVGGYAWARQGYDFEDVPLDRGNPIEDKITKLAGSEQAGADAVAKVAVSGDGPQEVYGIPVHSWELASMDDGKQHLFVTDTSSGKANLGKAVMIGASYHGVKSLDPASSSQKVGNAYYAHEKAKRR